MVVVGEALPNRLNVSPRGNFNPQYTTDVTASKFQLLLGSPSDADLANDFSIAVDKLRRLQAAVATSTDRRYLIEGEGRLPVLRFSSPMFETKVC